MRPPDPSTLRPIAPLGALVTPDGTGFRVWAPRTRAVTLEIEQPSRSLPMRSESGGYFHALVSGLESGARYRFRLDGEGPYPDPCSRFQPEGPHGPSMVVDARAYRWRDGAWRGVPMHGQVIYELHVGTFTSAGTFDVVIERLDHLRRLGVTALEIMPVHEFPGRWNWGYDGVGLYAPFHGYGDSDALRRLVDAAHACGLAVILDVVYNHFGPGGNYLGCYSRDYFTGRYRNDWGESINFDGHDSAPVREFFIQNACCWIEEFHLDGLRLDATRSIHDASARHVLADLSVRARGAAGARTIILTAENEPQEARYVQPLEAGGFGLDGMWNDDFHHAARVALTGNHTGYLHDYRGRPQEFVSAAKRAFLFQGQFYAWQNQGRGTPVGDRPAWAFVHFIQNHDQVANTLDGTRLHALTSPGRLRAMTALLLLSPQTPLLFMGQEFAASAPFPFFADHCGDLHTRIWEGRREFLSQFTNYAHATACVPDPCAEATFLSAKLDWSECEKHAATLALHADLLRLRRDDPVIAAQDWMRLDGAVLGEKAFVLRWFDAQAGDRLLLVNLGDAVALSPAPEPLLAEPAGRRWDLVWSSDDPRYGGQGVVSPLGEAGWSLSGECAVLLLAEVRAPPASAPSSGPPG
ncbi:MAG: malto-oligosyltrehalose trehalohydrolase [Burkholderiales bacterium]|nr:malto-oligosyltrehalose trehalohydrolase [Burkholderiales bacterium]